MPYCSAKDVNAVLPQGSLSNPGRLLESVDVTAGVLRLGDHGFVIDDEVTFRAEGCGSLSEPLDPDVTYFVVPQGPHAFRLKASADATVELQLYSEGGDTLVIAAIPWAKSLDWGAAMVDSYLPGHALPLSPPYHPRLVYWNAVFTAQRLLSWCGSASADLNSTLAEARKDLEPYAKGLPLRGENSPPRANLAISATSPPRDKRGWRAGEGVL
jgi:hypothetical protein